MIFIADGGSTKADWRIIDSENNQLDYATMGFNPFFYTEEMVLAELQKSFVKDLPVKEATKVFFYGSGCSDTLRKEILANAFRKIFPNAEIIIEHDLLASAKATCGDEPGIACILGTGSNSCLYDGEDVIDNITNLGYLLGDEGSGTHLAKKLIRAYYYRELPSDLEQKFTDANHFDKRELLNRLYTGERANVYLASFSRFLFDNKEHIYTQQLVRRSIAEFVDRHIMKYEHHEDLPIHFVGSIAYYFSFILESLLAERNLTLGSIVKRPIDNLVTYHLKKEKAYFEK
ncbi:MAG: glucosamine kinase [Saprospiraceae bacterium]|jgi:glucosamine kinase